MDRGEAVTDPSLRRLVDAALPASPAMDDLIASSGQPLAGLETLSSPWTDDDDDDDDMDDFYDDDDDDADYDDGMLPPGDNIMTCPRCLGDGFVSENRLDAETCDRCNGNGFVAAPEDAP